MATNRKPLRGCMLLVRIAAPEELSVCRKTALMLWISILFFKHNLAPEEPPVCRNIQM